MGRPPHAGGPVFRFTQNEVLEMEACLQEVNHAIPPREIICAIADKFSSSPERQAGKVVVLPKQVWNWFQNRRYAQRAKLGKAPGKLSILPMPRDESLPFTNVPAPISAPSGRNSTDNSIVEFEAKSVRDGACYAFAQLSVGKHYCAIYGAKVDGNKTCHVLIISRNQKICRYDVSAFLSHRMFETGDPEVRVRFSGFGVEEDEWINVRRCIRQRSLPCEAAECVAVLPGDLILCFQEGKEQALYFDAHVLDVQRRRHDVRGCRCRFLVRYDHDQSEEIVPLRKVCRRPETDYRLQVLQASKLSGSVDLQATVPPGKDLGPQKTRKQRKLMDVNTDEVTTIPFPKDPVCSLDNSSPAAAIENSGGTPSDVVMEDASINTESVVETQNEANA